MLCNFLSEHDVPAFLAPDDQTLPVKGRCTVSIGAVSAGMEYPGIRLAILTDAQLLRRKSRNAARKKLPSGRVRIESFADLSVGDYVVHENHGIGKFTGIVRMEVDGYDKDYVKIANH